MTQECYSNCLSVVSTCELDASRARSSLTHKHAHVTEPTCWKASVAWVSIDTEAGMLSGISRKRSIRSNPYWFTEFCNSQCISHFAAPFIVVRAETSVAESCKTNLGMTDRAAKEKIREKHKEWFKRQGATTGRGVEDGPSLPAALEFPTRGIAAQKRTTPSPARASHGSVHGDSRVDIACE